MKINAEQLYARIVSLASDGYHTGFVVIIVAFIATVFFLIATAFVFGVISNSKSRGSHKQIIDNDEYDGDGNDMVSAM